jgi:hypothetical protein
MHLISKLRMRVITTKQKLKLLEEEKRRNKDEIQTKESKNLTRNDKNNKT